MANILDVSSLLDRVCDMSFMYATHESRPDTKWVLVFNQVAGEKKASYWESHPSFDTAYARADEIITSVVPGAPLIADWKKDEFISLPIEFYYLEGEKMSFNFGFYPLEKGKPCNYYIVKHQNCMAVPLKSRSGYSYGFETESAAVDTLKIILPDYEKYIPDRVDDEVSYFNKDNGVSYIVRKYK
jgi:hypothetical protein